MSILVDRETRVIVQGFTGKEGTFHAQQMIAYGTNVVGGVTPGKGGQTHLDRPVFNTVARRREGDRRQRVRDFRAAAVRRRRDHGGRRRGHGRWWCASPKAFPTMDMVRAWGYLKGKPRTRLIGPNCPGIISPGECKIGIMPGHIHRQGPRGRGVALGHADLRSGGPVDDAGHRAVDLHRHRRRPDHRHDVPGRDAAVQRRPGDATRS